MDALWKTDENGFRRCLRWGEFTPGVTVVPTEPRFASWRGTLVALVPTWGDGAVAAVKWEKCGRRGPVFWPLHLLKVG